MAVGLRCRLRLRLRDRAGAGVAGFLALYYVAGAGNIEETIQPLPAWRLK